MKLARALNPRATYGNTLADCDQALDTLIAAVHRHTGGHGHDDMALLLLEHGASPHGSANGHPAAAARATVKTVTIP